MTETCTISVMLGIEKKRGTPQGTLDRVPQEPVVERLFYFILFPLAAGVIMPGVTIHVMRSDGTLAGYDEEGELVVKTLSVANGYFNNKQAQVDSFT